jgi:pimeloyl-ACP methyl ester carboxylesterase
VPADLLGGFQPAAIDFEGCGDSLECGTLAVPLDWSNPSGPTIDLAVARIPAGDPDERIGVLATNPGGPGASGVGFIRGGGHFAGTELAERFDIVSWDPRGVDGSAGLSCDDAVREGFLRLDSDPDDAAEQAALDAGAAEYAASCAAEHGELLAHVGTDDTARDLEAIRRALGQPLAYVGFSYGTFIGLRYAELFPDGAVSIVLDGVVDPTAALTDLLRGQAEAFEGVLTEALGDLTEEWDEVAAAVEREPLPTDDGRGLGPADLATGTFLAGYDPALWEVLQQGVRDAAGGDGSILLRMADQYHSLGAYAPYQAISCLDSANPVGGEAWAAFSDELEAISPRFGASIANEMLPCAFWPVPSEPVNGPVLAEGSPPILVVGTTGDPATPVEQAERVAEGLADGHLLVLEGEGHVAFGRSACVQDAVERYLIRGEVPPEGARC